MRGFAMILALAVPAAAQAHEVWVERDRTGPVRVYLGEPAEPIPAGGDPEFAKLVAPKVVGQPAARLERRTGYLETVLPSGDVRVTDDSVFAPWGEAGAKEGVIYYARAGRGDTATRMAYEIAPLAGGGNQFALKHDGKPVPGAKITVVSPDKWTKVLTADAAGSVTVPMRGKGRYLLSATQEQTGQLQLPAGPVGKLYHTVTTTFVAP